MKILVRTDVDTGLTIDSVPVWHIFDSDTYKVVPMSSIDVVRTYGTIAYNTSVTFVERDEISKLFVKYSLLTQTSLDGYTLQLIYRQIDNNWYIITGNSLCMVFYNHRLVYESCFFITSYVKIADDTLMLATDTNIVMDVKVNVEDEWSKSKTKLYLDVERVNQLMPAETQTLYYMDCLWTSGNINCERYRKKRVDFKHKRTGREFYAVVKEFNFSESGINWFEKSKDEDIPIPSCPTNKDSELNESALKILLPTMMNKVKEAYKTALNGVYLLKEGKSITDIIRSQEEISYDNLCPIISIRLNQILEKDLDFLAQRLHLIEVHVSLKIGRENDYILWLEAIYPDGRDIIGNLGRWSV